MIIILFCVRFYFPDVDMFLQRPSILGSQRHIVFWFYFSLSRYVSAKGLYLLSCALRKYLINVKIIIFFFCVRFYFSWSWCVSAKGLYLELSEAYCILIWFFLILIFFCRRPLSCALRGILMSFFAIDTPFERLYWILSRKVISTGPRVTVNVISIS